MYRLQETAAPECKMSSGSIYEPVATLKDEHGGISHIIEDDTCYVLVNGSAERPFQMVHHWYPEAVEAMKTLPPPQVVKAARMAKFEQDHPDLFDKSVLRPDWQERFAGAIS